MPLTTVTISASGFSPNPVTVHVGDRIEWSNTTNVVQDATGTSFTTGPIPPGQTSLPLAFDFADPGLNYNSTTGFNGTVVVMSAETENEVHWPQVRALFTDEDVAHMIPFGLDLSNKDAVCSNFDDVLDRVTRNGSGRMPPPPRQKWSDDDVNLLRNWKAAGCPD